MAKNRQSWQEFIILQQKKEISILIMENIYQMKLKKKLKKELVNLFYSMI